MAKTVQRIQSTEARCHLGHILRRAATGGRFLVTRYGHPVAAIVGSSGLEQAIEVDHELAAVREHLEPLALADPDTPTSELARLAVLKIIGASRSRRK